MNGIDWEKVKDLPASERARFISNQILIAVGEFSAKLKQKGIPNQIKIQVQVTVG